MAVGVGIWLALIGYTIAWAGWRNIGITYTPQSDGSVQPSAKPVDLLGAFTCKDTVPNAPAPAGSSTPASSAPLPGLNPALQPAPNPVPAPAPAFSPTLAPAPAPAPNLDYSSGFLIPRLPAPAPAYSNTLQPPASSGLQGILDGLRRGVGGVLGPILKGLPF